MQLLLMVVERMRLMILRVIMAVLWRWIAHRLRFDESLEKAANTEYHDIEKAR